MRCTASRVLQHAHSLHQSQFMNLLRLGVERVAFRPSLEVGQALQVMRCRAMHACMHACGRVAISIRRAKGLLRLLRAIGYLIELFLCVQNGKRAIIAMASDEQPATMFSFLLGSFSGMYKLIKFQHMGWCTRCSFSNFALNADVYGRSVRAIFCCVSVHKCLQYQLIYLHAVIQVVIFCFFTF